MTIIRSRQTTSAGARMNRRDEWLVANDIKLLKKRKRKQRRRKGGSARLPRVRRGKQPQQEAVAKVKSMPAPTPRPTTRDE